MSFIDDLRVKIHSMPLGSEKNLLKVILGDLQNPPGSGKSKTPDLSDERCRSYVKKMIESNKTSIGYLREGDSRIKKLEDENQLLKSLLPTYLSADEIRTHLANVDVKSVEGEGEAMSVAMKHLKSLNLNVEGKVVREVVKDLRCSG